jgi:Flp pilus assembly pilin Flp
LVSWANFKVQWKKIKKIGTLLGCNKRKIDKLIKERRGNPGKINRGRNSGARMQTRTAGSPLGSCDGKQPTQHLTQAQRSKKKIIKYWRKENMEKIRNFFKDESGANMVEYALLTALIGVMLIGGLKLLQGGIAGVFGDATSELNAVSP